MALCVLCATPRGEPDLVARWQPYIAEASERFGVPQSWITAVMRAESDGLTMRKDQPITSGAGAMGLMQIMPDTYAELRHRYRLGSDPYAPRDNILAGAAYLSDLYRRYGYPNLFAAYNAGPERLDAFLLGREPLPSQTLAYIGHVIPGASIAGNAVESSLAEPLDTQSDTLFFALHSATNAEQNPSADSVRSEDSLFVPLSGGRR